ncbi:hypothetical protein A3I48_01630 [Candidatus Daviesbacteria bacterium RIFCSPLOWO2_02_FULL_36_7]|uniref:Radical SAM core domain-containing protein n=1 Tax=Candidatus Daviesbacteria bacterium RIFCSPLOWO2_02_FULL_36_7 TaxID=1797792 RepID=A0A1F5MGB6_9BACT|nr:MAG: hypothetical protein A3I48_01630 [Candidatus Daviesbacteria bacterium RIFCSPLOWO2_02_FULL_36_7]
MPEFNRYFRTLDTLVQFRRNDNRYFAMEQNRGCNRSCFHCGVRDQYDSSQELTLEDSCRAIDRLYGLGARIGTGLGGEPLMTTARTKEGITFYEHTLEWVRYAKRKGMLIGISTNGDFFTEYKADQLKKAGLDWITFSLHTETKKGLNHLVDCAKMAADNGIVPIIHDLITSQNADYFPGIAAHVAENGILVNATVVQEKGGSFSTKPETSLIPTKEQQARVFTALAHLKNYGFVRINKKLLLRGLDYYPNGWKCNPEADYFLHIGAGGTLDVCEEARTDWTVFDIDNLNDKRWRDRKRELIKKCTGCLYRCYYESENPSIRGELTTLGVMALIKIGGANLVRRWGQVATQMSRKLAPDIDWQLQLV